MLNYIEFIQPDNLFLWHLIDDFSENLISESIPTSDFIKELRKIGVDNANKLGLTSLEKFESRLKLGFSEATEEILKYPNLVKQKTAGAYTLFHNFLHERTVAANNSAKIPSKNKEYSKNGDVKFSGSNKKTQLSSDQKVSVKGLSLPPFNSAYPKFNCCPSATIKCKASCLGLYAGGAKIYPETSFLGKLIRLQFMVEYPKETAYLIHDDLVKNEKYANDNKFLSGFRANITSDLDFIKLFPLEFFETLHKDTQFYDYTKVPERLASSRMHPIHGEIKKPKNYFLSLSHTGTNHKESNDKDVIKALESGHLVTMVVTKQGFRNKDLVSEVKGVMDDSTGKIYPVVSGDNDDNIFDRHKQANIPPNKGIVSIVNLKGTSKEKSGEFVNTISDDGYIHINKPQ